MQQLFNLIIYDTSPVVARLFFDHIWYIASERVNKNIDQLFRDQGNLVKLTEEETHILSAGLEELYNATASHRALLKKLEVTLQNKVIALDQESEKNTFLWELSAFSWQFEAKVDHLVYSHRELLKILNDLCNRMVHPKLLQHNIVQKVINDVRQSENDVDLPIPLHHARAEEIAKIATIDATYHSGRIIASLTLPLVERTAYDLYQLHSVAIPQKATL